ncbi:MAG: nucleotidyl transferase AbiEii/AbiGii toxin family protein [Alphaproteobacteria bacterium]|jgi:predicted nucleotidyltransferase component of viral defense system|nr:nucleotidyl transferase AbiEii/AbiGii toxin family protein [Alphaproteobacteria bacterium]MBT5389501.1 nucleotidyl transferase AbiEii/AbiGii toxin family protein [Alphaproteobacteria bacterium]MBT5540481.1 nucleotidyl transferase AbiEii/AbiGii toxin family protein [Alphaproteobacteria bacterium]
MIPQNFITEWKNKAPWQDNAQVEQDLILSRSIVEIFSNKILRDKLIFRGGTALHKLYSPVQERYSEDLDFVQKHAGPIGGILEELHDVLDPWLGAPKWKQTKGRITFYYRYESEVIPVRNMKVKIEINTREHFKYSELVEIPFGISNRWFEGEALVASYSLEELLGTKMRALYQRKKGRDLFDLMVILKNFPDLDRQKIVNCFLFYLDKEGLQISKAEFEKNMHQKLRDKLFLEDTAALLQPNRDYNHEVSYSIVHKNLISLLPGLSWVNKTREIR